MATYRVTIAKVGKLDPFVNPFRIRVDHIEKCASPTIERTWEFEADDEDEVRKLFREAQEQRIPSVIGFELRNIERISP